jgi:hypothetical protein|tara:strand:+ start:14333 stop:14758 length:426 start_codon:yes stop_codon:yes gene_type:complete
MIIDTKPERQASPAVARSRRQIEPAIIGVGHNRPPSGVPAPILWVFAGSFAVLLLMLSIPAMTAAPMPLVFAICLICLVGYFGGGLMSPIGRESLDRVAKAPVETGSGLLSVREAAWQILPLPIALTGFGMFAAILKMVML